MRYSIFYLLSGKAKEYNQRLIKKIGPKYGENYMLELNLPPHITIKNSFESTREKEIIRLLNEFAKRQKTTRLDIEGFRNFRKFVAFLQVKFSREARNVQRELYKELEKKGITKPQNQDILFKPHATIAYGNTKDTFNLIWNELNKLKKPTFKLEFDNLTLMKETKKGWIVYKKFKIK